MSDTIETSTPAASSAAPGVGAPTLPAAFQATVTARGDQVALIAFGEDRTLTWAEYAAAVEETATGLYDVGVRHGDTVALMLSNSPEFHIVDTAVQHLGATPFSIYLTSAPEQISYLFDNADNKVLVAESRFLDVISSTDTPGLDTVVVVNAPSEKNTIPAAAASILTLDDVRRRRTAGFDFEQAWRSVQSSDLATLIYTSATTGAPKGVELTHANLMFVMHTCNQRFPFDEDGAAISYLPTAHAADRVFSHYLSTVTGWPITTVADAGSVFGAVAQARPSWFLGVPPGVGESSGRHFWRGSTECPTRSGKACWAPSRRRTNECNDNSAVTWSLPTWRWPRRELSLQSSDHFALSWAWTAFRCS